MFDLVKQTMFTGLGLASLTKEKLGQLAAEISEKAKLSEKQAREFQDELEVRGHAAQQELKAQIDRQIDHALIQMGLLKAGARQNADMVTSEFQTMIDQRIDVACDRLGLARSEAIESLTARLELLERKLAAQPIQED